MGSKGFGVGLRAQSRIQGNGLVSVLTWLLALSCWGARSVLAVMIAWFSLVGLAQAQAITGSPTANPTTYSRIGDTTTFTVSFNTGGVAWNGINTISVGSGTNGTVSNINCNVAPNNATNQNLTCTFAYTFGSDDVGSDFLAVLAVKISNTTMTQNGFVQITYNAPPSPTSFSASANPNPWSLGGQNVALTATASGPTGAVNGRVTFYTSDGASITSTVTTLMTNGSASTNLTLPANTSTILAYYRGGSYGPLSTTIERFVPVLTLTPTASATTIVGVGYSQTNAATNGTAPYTFARTQGALPAGTTLNQNTGTVSGTPTAAGNFSYRITVTDAVSAQTSTTVSGTIAQGANTITFPALANTAFTALPPVPAASASSNLPVTYSTTTSSVCTVAGGVISFVSAGSCSIKASQGGNANFVQANDVIQSFTITPGANTITFPALPNTAFIATPPNPAATASSNLAITYSTTTSGVCTVTSTGTISFVSAGTCSITASQGGNGGYVPATNVSQSFNVIAGTTIALGLSPNPSVFGQAVTLTATVSSEAGTPTGTVEFTEGPASLGTVALNGAGVASLVTSSLSRGSHFISAAYAGSAAYNASGFTTQVQVVNQGSTTTFLSSSVNPSTFGQSVTLTATVSPASPAAGTPSGDVAFFDGATLLGTRTLDGFGQATLSTSGLNVGAHSLSATYASSTNFAASTSSTRSQTVSRAANTITFPALANLSFTTAPPTLAATASSSIAVTYSTTTDTVCTVTGAGVISFVSVGSCSITASEAGDANYEPATDVTRSFNVTPGSNVFVFPTLPDTAFTAAPPVPAATSSANVTITYSTTTGSVCTVTDAGAISFVSAGLCSIKATPAPDPNFVPAFALTRSFNVTLGVNTITFPALPNTGFNATPPLLGASASSNLAVTYSTTTGTVCTVTSGGTITLVKGGTCSITASQAGDANFAAATPVTQSFSVSPVPTLTSSPNPSIHNQSVRLQAVVSAATAAPTGTVTFRETGVGAPLGSVAVATARYTKVVAGGNNMCGIVSDTTLECWGYNAVGQLGDGTESAGATTPVQVAGLIGVTNVEVGNDHICAVMSDKTLKCWGNNVYGQVGNTTGGQVLSPTTVTGLADVTAVALGTSFSCALKSDGTVACWGRNYLGQLGIGNTTDTNTPTAIPGLTNVTAITAGSDSACALKSDGTVSCWGSNEYGALGDGSFTNSSSPRSVLNLSTAVTISADGGYQVCALLTNATVQCWGRNDYGQLGTGTATTDEPKGLSTSQTVTGITNATNVTSGNGWSCAALATGNPKCWGYNYYGALAQGGQDNSAHPTPLDTPAYAGAVYFAFGGGGGCAILANDTITCTGENFRGQLGNGRSGFNLVEVTATNVIKTFTKSVAVVTRAFTAGTHTLIADFAPTIGALTTSADVVQTVNKLSQTITFPALADTAFTATPPMPAAMASSGLTVGYDTTTPLVCSVTSVGAISFSSAGTCSIRASQAGDASREAATPVTQSFNVTPGVNTITFPALADTAFTATPPALGATASSNLTVSYASSTPACTVAGGVISFVSAGTCTITASQAGDTNFAAAAAVMQSFNVTPGANVITFPALADTAFTATPPTLGATASSNLTIDYSTTTGNVCSVTGAGAISFLSAGTCSITASQLGNTNFAAATAVTQSFTVTPGVNTITFPTLANTAFTATPPTLGATASSNLTIDYSTTTGTVCSVTGAGAISFLSVGTCSITASQLGNSNFAAATAVTQSFTVTPGVNTITFPVLANTAFTSAPPIPAATASSNLTVIYDSTTPLVCTATGAGAITFVKAGTCTISASQAGDANFAAATDATQSFIVTPGVNTITFPALANTAFTSAPPIPAATASSNLMVIYDSTTPLVCTATGAGAINFVKAGTCSITASQAGDANFAAATDATQSFIVTPGVNTITFPALANTAFTATPPVPAATASSNLMVIYDSTTPLVCTATGAGAITFVKAGTCTISASQAGNASYAAATPASRSFTVTPGVNTITFPALATTAFTSAPPVPAATASSNLTVTYASSTPACTVTGAGVISFVSAGACTITASQAGNANFAVATAVTRSFNVTPGANTIAFPALANTAFTATPPVPAATSSSKLAVTYASTSTPVCTVTSAGVITFVKAGTCTISASQAGNANFAAATAVTRSFNVTPGVNTITFPALANTAFTATPPVPAATASSKLAVTYASTTAPVCTVTGAGVITFVKAGTCTISASQAGNANFAAATAVTRSFNVTPGVNTITFPALANTAFTATPPVPAATASSKLAVTYASTTAPVCTVTGAGVITFVKAGTCTISASQAGNANFAAATAVTRSFNVTPGTNTITFPALANTAFTATPPVPAATASSKLAVTYASTTAPVCTVTGAGVITFVKAGTCTISASQAGNANFAAATAVTRSFNVTPGTNTITFPALANTAFTATPPVPAATSSSKLAITYASTTAPVCTVAGAGVITFVKAGTCTISASQAGNANFAAATVVTSSFTITPGANTITFPALANTAFTSAPPVPAATSSSKLAITYASTTAPVCTATAAGVITFVKAGTCTITASQAGNASYAAATPVSRSFTVLATVTVVTTSSKTPAAYGVPVTFTAKVTVPAGGAATGTVTFKDGGKTIGVTTLVNGAATLATAKLEVGAHSITASYDGNATQGPGVSVALAQVITKANPVLTLTVTPNPVEAGQPVALAATLAATPVPATGPSGSIVFRDGATVIGSTTILAGKAAFSISTLAPGGHSLTASYAGDARFAASTSAAMPLTVQRSCKDAFASATAFTEATGSASGSTATATGESGEGRHGGDTGAINSVWCKWTAPAAGRVTIDTTGSTFDTTLAVYTGASLGQLTKVAANDNIDAATRQSRVSFTAVQGRVYRIAVDGAGAARGSYVLSWTQTPAAPRIYASVLPASRSMTIGSTATAFATIINSGSATATGCGIALPAGFPAAFWFQTTNAANVSTGAVATAVSIPAGGMQRFVFGVTPTNAMEAAEIPLVFDCANTQPAASVAGLNRFTLTAAAAPSPDIIAIASTLSNDGIVTIPASGPGLFTAASLNIGAAGTLTVQADDGGRGLPLAITLCRNNPTTGACATGSTPKPSLRIAYGAKDTVTFTVFVKATGTVAFDPALNRVQLRWKTDDGVTRGITSVAVKTK